VDVVRVTEGLVSVRTERRLEVRTPAQDGPVLVFHRRGERVTVDLLLLGIKTADLSEHPGAVVALIGEQARRADVDRNGWLGALERHLRCEFAGWGVPVSGAEQRSPAGTRGDALLTLLGAATMPLLADVYRPGMLPLREIPRWAAPALRETRVVASVRAVFGSKGTRAVARAFADSLRPPPSAGPGASVALAPLAVALVGADVLEPDHLACLLAELEPWQPPHRWPSNSQICTARRAAAFLGARRARMVLTEALHGGDPRLLFTTFQLVDMASDYLAGPLPNRLADLLALCQRHLSPERPAPDAHAAAPPVRPAAPAQRAAGARVRHPAGPPVEPLLAPTAPRAGPGATFDHPAWLAVAHGQQVGRYQLCLPGSPAELRQWGNELGNCLGSFVDAVSGCVTWVIAVREDGRLIGCAEITPTRSVRQLLGPHNRPLPQRTATAVVAELTALGVVAAEAGGAGA